VTSNSEAFNDVLAGLDIGTLLSQLRYPRGDIGNAVGNMMEHVNAALIDAAYSKLNLQANERIVEIGLGNGGHIASVLTRAPRLRFAGVDVSPTMIAAARSRNGVFVEHGQVLLETASVTDMPFPRAVFDKAIAINAIYFWPDLTAGMREIRRVLRKDGVLMIAAMTPETSLTMPFTEHGFQVYGSTALRNACFDAGFNHVQIERYAEKPSSPANPQPTREFFLVRTSFM
jgi:ubiquinone/menaquinone biosynthesis C-methylase UbiE